LESKNPKLKILRRFLLLALLLGWTSLSCNKNPAPSAAISNTSTSQPNLQPIDPATTASISGAVGFEDAPLPDPTIDMSGDPGCALATNANPQPKDPARAETVLVNHGKLQNAFVYVKSGLEAYAIKIPSVPAILDQRGCRYIPHVLGIVAGQTLRILNSDKTLHNVHPLSSNNPQWNDSQMPGGAPREHIFSKPELLLPIACNQHPWMKMYVNIVQNPFFSVSDAQGKFEIRGLPPGEYVVEAVHERLGIQDVKITLAAHEQKSIGFTFKP
jgi:plastocyanin